ncbi:hypothetical protein [Marinobacter sp. DUT-1]
MTTQGGDGLDIGLDAGATGGIESGQYKNLGTGVAFDGSAP